MPDPQNYPFSKPLEFLQKVKYGGAVGKKTVVTVVMLIVLAVAILALWGNVEAVLSIVGVALIVFFGSLLSMDKTLKAHPELALMVGSEFIALRKAELAAKNIPVLQPSGPVPDPQPVVVDITPDEEIES